MPEPDVVVELLFRKNTRAGKPPVSRYEHDTVILGEQYPNTAHVKPGETWRCTLHRRPTCWVAEPLERISAAPPPVISTGEPKRLPEDPIVEIVERETTEPVDDMVEITLDSYQRNDSVALLIHGPDMEEAQAHLGWDINWKAVRDLLTRDARLAGAYYYDGEPHDRTRRLHHDELDMQGFTILTIPIASEDDEALEEARAMLDTEFILDAAHTASRATHLFLFTHSARFAPLIPYIRRRGGKRVFIVSATDLLPRSLRHVADKPIFSLEQLALFKHGGVRIG